MLDASLVGTDLYAGSVAVETGPIQRLAESLGVPPARDAGGRLLAPPGLLLSLVPADALQKRLGAAPPVLHASEVQLDQRRPVRAGEVLEVTSRVVDVVRRPGPVSKTVLVVVDDEARAAGEVVFRARRVWAAAGGEAA